MPETRLPSPPKMKYSQQPAQGFAETYKLPFPQTQLFVPFQVFDLFQNTEDKLSSSNLRSANQVIYQDDISTDEQANHVEVISNQDFNMASLNHSAISKAKSQEQDLSSQSSNYDSADDTPEQNPVPTPEPVKRYPSRKRQVPKTFQYEEIVNKKPFKK